LVKPRIIIFTGKGGTGKTTCAAATAVRCAEIGKKTLVLSSDPAQALSEALDTKLGIQNPREIKSHLYGLEIDLQSEIDKNYGRVRDFMERLFKSRGIDAEIASEMAALPGMDEVFSILKIQVYKDQFDVIVLDTAPTGHTFRLLSLPQIFTIFDKTFMKLSSGIAKFLEPFGNRVEQAIKTPVPTKELFDQMEDVMSRIRQVHTLLEEGDTTVRIVTNLEKMPIQESERALTFMSLYGLLVDSIVVNKVLPKSQTGEYFSKWHEIQDQYLNRIENSFHPLKILKVRLFEEEVIGLDLLSKVADDMYGKEDPTKKYADKKPFEFKTDELGNFVMSMELPFARKGQTKIKKKGEELIVSIGENKRIILLPNVALNKKVIKAYFEGKKLFIIMGKDEDYEIPID